MLSGLLQQWKTSTGEWSEDKFSLGDRRGEQAPHEVSLVQAPAQRPPLPPQQAGEALAAERPPPEVSLAAQGGGGLNPYKQGSGSTCSIFPYDSPMRTKVLQMQEPVPASKVPWTDKVEAQATMPVPMVMSNIDSSLYNSRENEMFPNERRIYTGTWENPVDGKSYHTFEDAPPPPRGEYQTQGGVASMRRLQGYEAGKAPNEGHRKQEVNFADDPAPEPHMDASMDRQRLHRMVNRDMALNKNDESVEGQQMTRHPTGYVGRQNMVRHKPFMAPTVRGTVPEQERREGYSGVERSHNADTLRKGLRPGRQGVGEKMRPMVGGAGPGGGGSGESRARRAPHTHRYDTGPEGVPLASGGVTESSTQRQRSRVRSSGVAECEPGVHGAGRPTGQAGVAAQPADAPLSLRGRGAAAEPVQGAIPVVDAEQAGRRAPQLRCRKGGERATRREAGEAPFRQMPGEGSAEPLPPTVQLMGVSTQREGQGEPGGMRPPQLRRRHVGAGSVAAAEKVTRTRERTAGAAPLGTLEAPAAVGAGGAAVAPHQSTRKGHEKEEADGPVLLETLEDGGTAQRPHLFRPIPQRAAAGETAGAAEGAAALPPGAGGESAGVAPSGRERGHHTEREARRPLRPAPEASSTMGVAPLAPSAEHAPLPTQRGATDGGVPVMLLQQHQQSHEPIFALPIAGSYGSYDLPLTQRGEAAPAVPASGGAGKEHASVMPEVAPDRTQRGELGAAAVPQRAEAPSAHPAPQPTDHEARPGKGRGREAGRETVGLASSAAGSSGATAAPQQRQPARRQAAHAGPGSGGAGAPMVGGDGHGAEGRVDPSVEVRRTRQEAAPTAPQLEAPLRPGQPALAPQVDLVDTRIVSEREPALASGGSEAVPSRASATREPHGKKLTAAHDPVPGEEGTDRQRSDPLNTAYNPRKAGAVMRERIGSPTLSMAVTERMVPESGVRRRKGGQELGEQWLERARSPTRPAPPPHSAKSATS